MNVNLPESVEDFFLQKKWKPSLFQKKAWSAYLKGYSGLIHAPTGTGKTLAVSLGPFIESLNDCSLYKTGLIVLWITPMRALARDTEKSLREICEGIGLPWEIKRRTGDTTSADRQKIRKNPPQLLITTPESFSLMLSYEDFESRLKTVQCVIVDEWHELLGSKRGVQLELCLSRIRGLNKGVRTWGLSATIGNVKEASDVLLGIQQEKQKTIITCAKFKKIDIISLIPKKIERFPWAGHLGLRLLPDILSRLDSVKSTLIFTNTRSQAELWFEALLKTQPSLIGRIALHHGSLDKKIRQRVEEGLKLGEFNCVVCTSSLDLGVDFSPVEQVIQIGSPKGIARLLQRAGRSGHRPGVTSKIICAPTNALELAEIAAARCAFDKKVIENRVPMRLCLDVLTQHCVTLATGSGFEESQLFSEIKKTHAFAQLTKKQWSWVLNFITNGGTALSNYPDFEKVYKKNNLYRIKNPKSARLHRMSIGTIVGDSLMVLKWVRGIKIGSIEESFISKLKKNDCFLFNGKYVQLVRVKEMTAYVKKAESKGRFVPRWLGGRAPLSTELSSFTQALLSEPVNFKIKEIKALTNIINTQKKISALPAQSELLVESCSSREGQHLFIFCFAGRRVNEGLAILIAWRLSRSRKDTFKVWANDYGLEILSLGRKVVSITELIQVLRVESLLEDLIESVNSTETSKRHFREIAQISGLVFVGYPGRSKLTRHLQASSGIIYDVLQDFDKQNLLIKQALEEVLVSEFEYKRLKNCLMEISKKSIKIMETSNFSPLAFPIWSERIRSQTVSSETWEARLNRMISQIEKKLS